MSPTIFIKKGYRFYFYSNEGQEPLHVHVQYHSASAKFWLNPVVLANNLGMDASELGQAAKMVKENENRIKEKWNEFFSRKK